MFSLSLPAFFTAHWNLRALHLFVTPQSRPDGNLYTITLILTLTLTSVRAFLFLSTPLRPSFSAPSPYTKLFLSPLHLLFRLRKIRSIDFAFLLLCSPLSVTKHHIGAGLHQPSVSFYAPQACSFCVLPAYILEFRFCRCSFLDITH